VAEAIFGEIGEDREIRPQGDVETLEGYDLVFVGSPLHGFGLNENVKEFIEEHGRGKNIALFVTHAAPEESGPLQGWLANCRKAASGSNLVGFFNCQGEMHKELAEAMSKMDDPQIASWGRQRHITLGQPDVSRLERARAFARETFFRISVPSEGEKK
jgi:flavodoxin